MTAKATASTTATYSCVDITDAVLLLLAPMLDLTIELMYQYKHQHTHSILLSTYPSTMCMYDNCMIVGTYCYQHAQQLCECM
jgi:isoleucyl-tRNA synthetase